MLQTLWSLLLLVLSLPVRGMQILLAKRRFKREEGRFQVAYDRYCRLADSEYRSPSGREFGRGAYLVHAQRAEEATQARDRAKQALERRAALTWFFTKALMGVGSKRESDSGEAEEWTAGKAAKRTPLRWLGFTSVFGRGISLVDVAVVLIVGATLYPGMLHYGVNVLHRVGTGVVAWVTETGTEAGPSIQEFLRDEVLGMGQGDSAAVEVAEEPAEQPSAEVSPPREVVRRDEPEFIQVVRTALQGTDPKEE